jgi:hypothetical protein
MKRKKFAFDGLSKQLRINSLGIWKPSFIISIVAAIIAGSFYAFRLGTVIGAGSGELQTIQQLSSLHGIIDNPLVLPYKLIAFLMLQLPGNPVIQVRLAAVLVALLSVSLFLLLAKRWYGAISGLATTTLFATSGWLLHTGRYGAGYISLVFVVISLMNVVVWLNNTDKSGRALLIFGAVAGLALYVPAGIWFVIATIVLCRQALIKHYRQASPHQVFVGSVIALVLVSGLIAALLRDTSLIRQWLGLPAAFPNLIDLAKQAALSVSGFVLRGPSSSEVWLAHTPILDAASSVLLLIGVIFYGRHLRNIRTHLLLTFAAIGIVLTALNGAPALGYLVPTVYLVLGGGLAYYLHQWKKVFPRNPIAEATALTVLGILILCIIGFHGQRYFVAWRYNPNTIQAYRHAAEAKGGSGDNRSNDSLPYLIQ